MVLDCIHSEYLPTFLLSKSQDTQSADKSIISVTVKADDSKPLAKQDVICPLWLDSLTVALKHTVKYPSNKYRGNCSTFQASPLKLCILHRILMLAQGISAVVVSPDRKKTIITDGAPKEGSDFH